MTAYGKKDEYFQTTDFWVFLKDMRRYIGSKRYWIITAVVICAAIGVTLSYLRKPRYVAELTFALQNQDDIGSVSGLASQFGLSLGSSTGAFNGDNIFQILTSRLLVEKALLTSVQTPEGTNTLVNVFIDTYNLKKQWQSSENENIRDLDFPPGLSRDKFTREQDSVLHQMYKNVSKTLTVYKVDKKLSIGAIEMISKSEFFSKEFVEKLMDEATVFYIDTKTKISRTNYESIVAQVDSVKREYDLAVAENASLSDRNLNAIRQSATVELIKKQTELQMLTASYIELMKSKEIMKLTLTKETPLVQVIDRPIYPLEIQKWGALSCFIIGAFFGLIMTSGFFLMVYLWKNRKSLL